MAGMKYLMFDVFCVRPNEPLDYFFFAYAMLLALAVGSGILFGICSMWNSHKK